MIRHKGFNSRQKLKKFLVEYVPKHAYYSTAYYKNPGITDMEGNRIILNVNKVSELKDAIDSILKEQ